MPHELDVAHGILTHAGVRVVRPVLSSNYKKSVTSFDAFDESHSWLFSGSVALVGAL